MKNVKLQGKLAILAAGVVLLLVVPSAVVVLQPGNTGMYLVVEAVCAVITACLTLVIYQGMAAGVRDVRKAAGILSEGDFVTELPEEITNRTDEYGDIIQELEQARENIGGMVAGARLIAEKMIGTVSESYTSVQNFDRETQNVAGTAENLAASMEETAASAEQISNMISQIEDAAKSIAEHSQEGAQDAAQIHDRANNAKEVALNSHEKAHNVNVEIKANLSKSLEDAKIVQEIDKLTQAIMGIASQTNLLALNASIEAARAGEAGKGFAVVAEEIRNLAEQSQSTAQHIQSITESVNKAVGALSGDASRLLEFISTDVSRAFHEFDEIASHYDQDAGVMDQLVTDFSATSQELLASIGSISSSAGDVDKASQDGAQGVTAIAASSDDLKEQAKRLLDRMQQAQDVSKQLEQDMRKFKVR